MAIADAYATVAQYKSAKEKTTADDDTDLTRQLLAVSRFMERRLGQFFNIDAAVISRLYTPRYTPAGYSPTILDVDPIGSTTGVVVKIDTDGDGDFDEGAIDATDYQLLPLNAAYGPEPSPYTQIEVTPWGDQGAWPVNTLVQVTAKYGWPAVPSAIIDACIELTALLRLETPRATNAMNELNQLVNTSRQAQGILQELMSVYSRYPVTIG